MRLVEIELELPEIAIPADVTQLLTDAKQRIDTLEDKSRAAMPAFVPSDFALVYRGLAEIESARLATGRRFVEWGSGIGAITCLAMSLGLDAVGIEIEQKLVDIAEELAAKHAIATQFVCGSFVPCGWESDVVWGTDVAWLTTDGPDAYCELELEPDDFDIIFAYPWPGEEQVIFDLFTDCAAMGALLLTYHGIEGVRLQRKVKR